MKIERGQPLPPVFYDVAFTPFWSSDQATSAHYTEEQEALTFAADLVTRCRPGKVSVGRCEGWDRKRLFYQEVMIEEARTCYAKANQRDKVTR